MALATTVAALLVSQVLMVRQLREVDAELKRSRRLLRELETGDPGRSYAVALPSFGKWQWRWQVPLPPGGGIRYYGRVGSVDPSFEPTPADRMGSFFVASDARSGEPRRVEVNAALHRNDQGEWTLTVGADGSRNATPSGGRTFNGPSEGLMLWIEPTNNA